MPDKYFNKKRESAYAKGGGRPIYRYNVLDLEADTAIGVMLPFNGAAVSIDHARHDHTTTSSPAANKNAN